MINLKKIIPRNTRERIMYGLRFLPDPIYLGLFYFATTGRVLNIKNPKGYNEKLQWLKIHDRKPEYHRLVDKLAVREYVDNVLGEGYNFPLLGYWESFEEIDFSKLPESFVLKCNHDSGSVKVIKNKSSISEKDMKELKKHFDRKMQRDFYYMGREFPYKGIKPYILAEKYMVPSGEKDINDYKFLCFDGNPEIMFTVSDRSSDSHEDYFDMDYNWLPIRNGHVESEKCPEKPETFEIMKEFAKKLAKGMRQIRIDFYEINGKIYFGEYTFFNSGGFVLFEPEEWEIKLGDMIKLN